MTTDEFLFQRFKQKRVARRRWSCFGGLGLELGLIEGAELFILLDLRRSARSDFGLALLRLIGDRRRDHILAAFERCDQLRVRAEIEQRFFCGRIQRLRARRAS